MSLKGVSGVFSDWLVYAFIAAINVFGALAIFFVNVGLARFQALVFIPSFNSLYISLGSMLGLAYYEEWKNMAPLGWAMSAVALVLIGSALKVLSLKAQPREMSLASSELRDNLPS